MDESSNIRNLCPEKGKIRKQSQIPTFFACTSFEEVICQDEERLVHEGLKRRRRDREFLLTFNPLTHPAHFW